MVKLYKNYFNKFQVHTTNHGAVKVILSEYEFKTDDHNYGSFINWEKVDKPFDFFRFRDKEIVIMKEKLKGSEFSKSQFIYLCSNPNQPIYKIDTEFFINNIQEIIYNAKYTCIFWSENLEHVIEVSDVDMNIFSNFEIIPHDKNSNWKSIQQLKMESQKNSKNS